MIRKPPKSVQIFIATLSARVRREFWFLMIGSILSLVLFSKSLLAQNTNRFGANRFVGLVAPNQDDLMFFLDSLSEDGPLQDSQMTIQKTQASIEKIRGLLREKPTSIAKTRLLRRLAAQYIDLSILQTKKVATTSERYTMSRSFEINGFLSPELNRSSMQDRLKSAESIRQAVEILRELSGKLSSSKVKQEVDLELGLALLRLESPDAFLYLDQYANQAGKTQKSSIAQLALAEHLVSKGKVNEAVKRLTSMTAIKSNLSNMKKIVDYSRFRLAWLRFTNDRQKGVLKGDDVASISQEVEDTLVKIASNPESTSPNLTSFSPGSQSHQNNRDRFDLVRESRFDLAQIWALQGKDQVAQAFFGKLKDSQSLDLFWTTYGSNLLRQGNHGEASLAIAKAIDGSSPNRLTFMAENLLIRAFYKSQQHTALVRTVGNIFVSYGPKSPWIQRFGSETAIKKLVLEGIKKRFRDLEEDYVNQAQKSDDSVLVEAALNLQNLHIATMPNDPNLWRVKLVSADILAKSGRIEESITRYLESFKSKGIDSPSRLRAGRKMVDLKVKLLTPEFNVIQLESIKSLPQSPKTLNLSDSMKILVEIVDRFSESYPKESDVPKLNFLTAAQLLNGGYLDPGLQRLDEITKKYPNTPEANQALKSFFEIHKLRKNFQRLVVWCTQFLKNPAYAKDQVLSAWVLSQLRDVQWAYSQQLISNKQDILAIKTLQQFQEMFPSDPLADLALSQMLDLHINRGSGSGAVSVADKLISVYPLSQYKKTAILRLADVYIQQAQFENAGHTMVTFAKLFPTDPKSPEIMLKGINQYEFAENIDMVRLTSQEFSVLFPTNSNALTVELKAADILEKNKDFANAIRMFLSIADRYARTRPEEAAQARAKAAVLTLNHLHGPTGRQSLNSLELMYFPLGGYQKAKEVIAAQKLRDLKLKSRELLGMASINPQNYASFEASHVELMRQVSGFQKSITTLIPISDTQTKVAAYLELGSIFDRIYRIYLAGAAISGFSAQEKEKYFKHREDVLSLSRQQCLASWQEGMRLAKADSSLFELHRQLSSKLSKIASGPYSDFNEEILDAKFVSHKVERD